MREENELDVLFVKKHSPEEYKRIQDNFKKRKKDILSKIFISDNEVLKIREKKVLENERKLFLLQEENDEMKDFLNNFFEDFINVIGSSFREFELKEGIFKGKEKELLTKLWIYLDKSLDKSKLINLNYKKFIILDTKINREKKYLSGKTSLKKKIINHKKQLKKLRKERKMITQINKK